ncbi:MAG: hypothetical protein INR73_03995 [Williamsia sp.]|nr:hypothetical protein [Williamsia sp.]
MSTPLADKLLNYQETPPQTAWQNIALALSETNGSVSLADKLNGYEVVPPAQTWPIIAAELQNGPARKPALIKKFPSLYKVSAAAVAIGLVCAVGFYLYSSRSDKDAMTPLAVKSKQPKHSQPNLSTIIKEAVPVRPLAILNKARAAISKKRKKYFAKDESQGLHNAAVDHISFADTLISIMVNTRLIRNEKGAIIQNLNLLSNGNNPYISVTGPNGEQTKVSSKFLNSLVYLRDNNYLDNFHGYVDKSFLESLAWKLKFQSWRKKLLEAPFIPSSYNYLDIFQFAELIAEDN